MSKSISVDVNEYDIANGRPGDCHRCAVALALARATGDDEAQLYDDWGLMIQLWGLHMVAPQKVKDWVYTFDCLPRDEDGDIDESHREYRRPQPFVFDIPGRDDSAWEGRCYRCQELFIPSDLDDEGFCKDCRE